jgi:hypothetical protein
VRIGYYENLSFTINIYASSGVRPSPVVPAAEAAAPLFPYTQDALFIDDALQMALEFWVSI